MYFEEATFLGDSKVLAEKDWIKIARLEWHSSNLLLNLAFMEEYKNSFHMELVEAFEVLLYNSS